MTESPQPSAVLQKKICMIGAFAVGKTSLVKRFVESIFDERYQTTIGVKIDRKSVAVRGQAVNLILWDLAGDDDLEQLRISHLRGASGYILVADGCRGETLQRAIQLQQRVDAVLGPVPFILAINKVDVVRQWSVEDSAIDCLGRRDWTIFRSSAKTGQNVENLFIALAEKMLNGSEERAAG